MFNIFKLFKTKRTFLKPTIKTYPGRLVRYDIVTCSKCGKQFGPNCISYYDGIKTPIQQLECHELFHKQQECPHVDLELIPYLDLDEDSGEVKSQVIWGFSKVCKECGKTVAHLDWGDLTIPKDKYEELFNLLYEYRGSWSKFKEQ